MNLRIEVPAGHVIDKEKSTFENIVFKKIDTVTRLKDIDRPWYIGYLGFIYEEIEYCNQNINNVPTKKIAEQLLALGQLLSFAYDVNKKDGFVPDWTEYNQDKWCIEHCKHKNYLTCYNYVSSPLAFKSRETAEKFLKNHKDLIEIAKEIL